MRLRCVGRYVNGPAGLVYQVGQVFDASSSLAAMLLSDAPECFEVVERKRARGRDKMVKAAPEDK